MAINLARGAKQMAKKQVIVKRLSAIENFGSMNVFCTDKTGTLMEWEVKIHAAVDVDGKESDRVPQLESIGAQAKQLLRNKFIDHRQYITKHGEDMPEILNWKWSY